VEVTHTHTYTHTHTPEKEEPLRVLRRLRREREKTERPSLRDTALGDLTAPFRLCLYNNSEHTPAFQKQFHKKTVQVLQRCSQRECTGSAKHDPNEEDEGRSLFLLFDRETRNARKRKTVLGLDRGLLGVM